jgi:hypothetical protein
MSKTTLLPPFLAVRTVWARTGEFAKETQSTILAAESSAAWKAIEAKARGSEKEETYVSQAMLAMKASLRSLETIYKGRELNFEENQKLRQGYLKSVEDAIAFGDRTKDFLKSLPAMVISSASGVTVAEFLGERLTDVQVWAIGWGLAGIGYFVSYAITKAARRRSQLLYVFEDYERSLYYDQYVSRAAAILKTLYIDLQRIHQSVFGDEYPVDASVDTVIAELARPLKTTFCPYVHKHISGKTVTPELWPRCESGSEEAVRDCPLWEGQQ